MKIELDKAYEAKKYEDDIYKRWEESGFFNPDNLDGDPYAIMMPPPNVTGVLHLGHALENTIMDTMARYQRMNGKKVLLLPGTDHAAVATQAKVEKVLVENGMKDPRKELGREGLLEKIREYAEESKSTILSQVRKLGTSADWSRLAYTFDDARNAAVNEMFTKMYSDGLIYRGHRVVNWSVKGQSTCSDDELVHVERPSKMYTFKYSKDFPITIASTRPETKLGDTAVAVHPEDARYKQYIGQTFTVDVGAAKPLEIKIIADPHVDMNLGTGALGVTPAHSQIDYEMYERQKAAGNDIGLIQVIGQDGLMTAEAGREYHELSVEEAREKFVQYLRENNLLENEEDIMQNVGTSDRFKDVVEAIPMTQWFVDVNKEVPGRGKSLKDLMKEAVAAGHNGDPNQKVNITPERFERVYYNWIDNLRDWCISRQIWWGHRIPVWYMGDEIYVGANAPEGDGWTQDEDTLDTWFSSGTWTFSTLGWPNQTDDLKTFHPTAWMQMGHEILFFWMARMILFSTYALDQIPFKDVYIHGLLRRKDGKKFSKSDGNTADPLDVIAKYNTDALRLTVLTGISPGNDSKFYEEKIEGARNMVTKLWNMSRFMLMNIEDPSVSVQRPTSKTLADEWILAELDALIRTVRDSYDRYDFSAAGEALREFTWTKLADWYLEIAKVEGEKDELLNYLLITLLKLWHPSMPFVTEAIYQEIAKAGNGKGKAEFLMVEEFPDSFSASVPEFFSVLQDVVTAIRSLRADYKVEPAKNVRVVIAGEGAESIQENSQMIMALARLEALDVNADKPAQAATAAIGKMEVHLDLAGAVDTEKERARLEKEIANVKPFVTSLEKKLSNDSFVQNAPEAVVAAEKMKLEEAKAKLANLEASLATIS